MDESVLLPSPNWFHVSVMKASSDGWLVYGGPSKSLCVLEPLHADYNSAIKGNSGFRAHVLNRAHVEKIVSVDLSPEWPAKKLVLAGSIDGVVKLYSITNEDGTTKIKTSLVLEVHGKEKEPVAGVGFSNQVYAITVGGYGNMVKWDVTSNVAKKYTGFMKSFKPNCLSCSPHTVLNVAVGTKQGVVFVMDLNDQGKLLYKVRAHDEEILNLSWCPQYEVEVKKALKDVPTGLAGRLELIRNSDNAGPENNAVALNKTPLPEPETNVPDVNVADKQEHNQETVKEPEVVQEDDTFDIYKDHEADEFGHKKYQPENIYVKVKRDEVQSDFLAECLKLKGDILKLKNEPEPSIESLVDALDNTHVKEEKSESNTTENGSDLAEKAKVEEPKDSNSNSIHIHRHLLATIGKYGAIRVWSKSGKLVSSGSVANHTVKGRNRVPGWTTVLWYKPDQLLIADAKSQLLHCDPTTIDAKNKLSWRPIHNFHKRGLYCITSSAPKVLLPSTKVEDWPIWTVAQDRNIIQYALRERKVLTVYNSCGGFVYTVATCPYDARRTAASVGDGAIRVWDADTLKGDETALSPGHVTTYWQNVQGKVLTLAWHPTRENLLAFATAEARVGLIETRRNEKPAKVLRPVLNSGIYGLCWGAGDDLYACGGGKIVLYNTNNMDEMPTSIEVQLEGKQWTLSEVKWTERGVLVGSTDGAVAALAAHLPHALCAAAFPFTRMIHCLEWHPQQISESSEDSPNKNLIAACSLEKNGHIAILQLAANEEGEIKLTVWKTLTGHRQSVLRVAWNPHREATLVSTSQDCTARVWDVTAGVCTAIFAGHGQATLGVAWSGLPSMADVVLSGGGDCTLRLWRAGHHPVDRYVEPKHEPTKKDKKKRADIAAQSARELESTAGYDGDAVQLAANLEKRVKGPKKFLLPIMHKELEDRCIRVCRTMVRKYIYKNVGVPSEEDTIESGDEDPDDGNETEEGTNEIQNGGNSKEDKIDVSEASGNESQVNTNGGESTDKTNVNGANEIEAQGDTNGGDPKEASTNVIGTNENEAQGDKNGDDSKKVDTNISGTGEATNGLGTDKKKRRRNVICHKLFGSTNEVNEYLDAESARHIESSNHEGWIMLSILRGNIDSVFQFASQRDILCPFLLSIAPSVSFKYWKDSMQLYLAQIDRLIAKDEEIKLYENKLYGGPFLRKVATLLSIHDVKGAVAALVEMQQFKEAYALCRVRHMDSFAEDTLQKWAEDCIRSGALKQAAVCYLAMDNLPKAASALAKSDKEENLSLASEIAKLSGQTTFADHINQRNEKIKLSKDSADSLDVETLEELPTKVELILKKASEIAKLSGQTTCADHIDQTNDTIRSQPLKSVDIEETLEELPTKMEMLLKEKREFDN